MASMTCFAQRRSRRSAGRASCGTSGLARGGFLTVSVLVLGLACSGHVAVTGTGNDAAGGSVTCTPPPYYYSAPLPSGVCCGSDGTQQACLTNYCDHGACGLSPSCAALLSVDNAARGQGWLSGMGGAGAFSTVKAEDAYVALDECACTTHAPTAPCSGACGGGLDGTNLGYDFCSGSAPSSQCNDCLKQHCASELAACQAN